MLVAPRWRLVRHGYPGAAEVDLAVENGEVQGEAGKDWTTLTSTRPQWIKDKTINILFQMGMKTHADLKDVPMAIDLARTPDDRLIMEIVFAKFGMSRPFFAPPGITPSGLPRCARVSTGPSTTSSLKPMRQLEAINPSADVRRWFRIMSTPPNSRSAHATF